MWSMISLPVVPDDALVLSLFPGAVVVYRYEKEAGYVRVTEADSLEAGQGYWILLNEAQSYPLTGQSISEYMLPINEDGWHMIGGCSSAAQATIDNGSINVIYRYMKESGYERVLASENLEPGKGYWILLSNVVGQAELTVK